MQEQSWLFEIFYFCEYWQNLSRRVKLFVAADLFFFEFVIHAAGQESVTAPLNNFAI
jgi:hypothetical protein